jgi:hypothetical protein
MDEQEVDHIDPRQEAVEDSMLPLTLYDRIAAMTAPMPMPPPVLLELLIGCVPFSTLFVLIKIV